MRIAALLLLAVVGCDLPGRPDPAARPVRPSAVRDGRLLYAENCAGCHGDDRRPGPAVALADPVYLAIVDDATLLRVTAEGIEGTAMPAFAQRAGGPITDEQVTLLVADIRRRWSRPDALGGAAPPPYAAAPTHLGPGRVTPDTHAERGAEVYATWCASCHGPGGRGGSIVDGSYLGLVSDQSLRTAVIVGRPRLGMPDWRALVPGRPLSAQDIDDVVAWLVAQRPALPGQPYPTEGRRDG
jgi:cytochrome c oxidase cbb3-type subunit 3